MRFKKGSKVEILSKKEGNSGSWRSAEIISGNAHNYTVRYDEFEGATYRTIVEKISRKAIRPCPFTQEVLENWVQGDVVEVFTNLSWKMATISEVLLRKNFLVRLLGSSDEFKVSRFDIRSRQIMIGKDLNHGDDKLRLKHNEKRSTRICIRNFSTTNKEINIPDSYSSTSKKRGPQEELPGPPSKVRALAKERSHQRLVLLDPSDPLYDNDEERRKRKMEVLHRLFELDSEPNGTDQITCSVGSCSINDHNFPMAGPNEDSDNNHRSDAESCSRLGFIEEEGQNCILPSEEVAREIHRLELQAYRSTMEALHAAGPLSWEQEELVTNLRLSLHISNDEHLIQIKTLISSDITSIANHNR